MYLEKLEILGFKSFAHKTILKFSPGIICVVGPNGSGKSNVSDSVRWVLGEQSIKTLRGKKAEDVIFAGSAKLARLGFAQVSLHLNNEDRKAPIDFSEIVITRRLYRNGESEYLLNKIKVRLQDILLLLAKANFGQRSYSIISQGTIDSILTVSPHERKEFFDEAAGVKQYQIKKGQTILKLDATKENLKQVEIMMQEIEPRLKSLSRQVKRLEKREEVEKKLKEMQRKYYGHLWRDISGDYQKQKNRFSESEQDYEKISREVADIQEKMRVLAQLKPEDKQISILQEEYQKILRAKNDFLREQVIWEGKIVLAKEKLKVNIVSFNQISSQDAEELFKKLEQLEKMHHNIITDLDHIESLEELEEIKQDINAVSAEISKLILKIKKPQKENPVNQKDIDSIEKNLQEIFNLTKIKEEKLKNLEQEISNCKKEEQKERADLYILQKEFQIKQSEFNIANNLNNEIRVELTRAETRREDLKREVLEELKSFEEIEAQPLENDFNPQYCLSEIHHLKNSLEVIGGIDPDISKEHYETNERFEFLTLQVNDLHSAIISLEKVIKELDEIIKKQFNTSFGAINQEFEKYFKVLFNGGRAKLSLQKSSEIPQPLVDLESEAVIDTPETKEEEKEHEGIEIQVTPPGKRLKNINLLSGGERALTSLALICAVISCNPSPFVILDEVDAALDEANSTKFADILMSLSHYSQFIVITHNRSTMEKAKILYGVTMGDGGVSKLLSLKLEDIAEN